MSTEAATHRLLVSFKPSEIERLQVEARKLGLKLATHIHSVVAQHLHANRGRK